MSSNPEKMFLVSEENKEAAKEAASRLNESEPTDKEIEEWAQALADKFVPVEKC